MKYFIDFEATQFTQEIISIGCVREDGQTFYSLIKPKKMNSMTGFITNLTGISKKDLINERKSDDVFQDFFEWLNKDSSMAEFYCYGNSDIDFLKNSLEKRTTNFKAQAALSIIITNLKDYSIVVKEYFGLDQRISLKKVIKYFYPKEEFIFHNALSDAEALRKIYFSVEKNKKVIGIPFPRYVENPRFKSPEDFIKYNIICLEENKKIIYESFEDASNDILDKISKEYRVFPNKKNINKKILKAINSKEKYFRKLWSVEIKTEED